MRNCNAVVRNLFESLDAIWLLESSEKYCAQLYSWKLINGCSVDELN